MKPASPILFDSVVKSIEEEVADKLCLGLKWINGSIVDGLFETTTHDSSPSHALLFVSTR